MINHSNKSLWKSQLLNPVNHESKKGHRNSFSLPEITHPLGSSKLKQTSLSLSLSLSPFTAVGHKTYLFSRHFIETIETRAHYSPPSTASLCPWPIKQPRHIQGSTHRPLWKPLGHPTGIWWGGLSPTRTPLRYPKKKCAIGHRIYLDCISHQKTGFQPSDKKSMI